MIVFVRRKKVTGEDHEKMIDEIHLEQIQKHNFFRRTCFSVRKQQDKS